MFRILESFEISSLQKSIAINTVLQMTFSTAKLIVPLSSFSSIRRIWIICPHLHVTSAGFICFKVTRVAYMYFNVADRNSFLMMYLLGSTMHIHSALGETWNLTTFSCYLFEYSLTPSSKFFIVNTRVRNQANLSPRTWSKRCDNQEEQKLFRSILFINFFFNYWCKILKRQLVINSLFLSVWETILNSIVSQLVGNIGL